MTAKATKRTPTTARRTPTALPAQQQDGAEFRRWTPEEVVDLQLLPYRSVRVLKERCYRREVFHHRDGGRITFTADDLRRQNELGAVEPLSA
ncbi:hypothetical protein ABZ869_01415 [Streptomyces sp. NPDC046928]|uniref:hypothetical protein n=1 Tax=Streptomyces sp. NPDC046928 TaxID=3155021 RepID=UPI0033C8004A